MYKCNELQLKTAQIWVKLGSIWETDRGSENIYFMDQFDNQYYCKVFNTYDLQNKLIDFLTLNWG